MLPYSLTVNFSCTSALPSNFAGFISKDVGQYELYPQVVLGYPVADVIMSYSLWEVHPVAYVLLDPPREASLSSQAVTTGFCARPAS